ncbi:VOC family protein [Sciscionella sediminilitoris]|uniref:VOC family protein n=1 Tax=Sciscionella sediminilitoris TaxID=1445613 RepID=UPI0004DF9776|nr:VOC family protein [Sciscionella sp. SE31]
MATRIFRLTIAVGDIERAAEFYASVLGEPGERVWTNRHYFHCGEVVLACVQPAAEVVIPHPAGDPRIVYLAVEDLEAVHARLRAAGPARVDDGITTQPWGERSCYAEDPFGNQLCFVDADTVYRGAR